MRTAAPGSSWFLTLVRLFNNKEDTSEYFTRIFTGSFFRELSSSSMYYYWIIHRGKNFKTKKSRVPYICVSRGMYFMMTYDVQMLTTTFPK